jgi:hypothetical protein
VSGSWCAALAGSGGCCASLAAERLPPIAVLRSTPSPCPLAFTLAYPPTHPPVHPPTHLPTHPPVHPPVKQGIPVCLAGGPVI